MNIDMLKLTKRESEVWALHHEGATNAEIAKKLVLAQGTVKVHVRNIYRKLGIKARQNRMRKMR